MLGRLALALLAAAALSCAAMQERAAQHELEACLEYNTPRECGVEGSSSSPTKAPRADPAPAQRSCCRHCSKGKPCGNGCIASNKTCHQPPGCACW